MECNKDEAIKAKELAERKLIEKDIIGAKKFALKAQHLSPKLDGLPQLLEIIDVCMAYMKKINGEADYYGVFGVDPFAHEDVLKKRYKRMALSLHPDKNMSVGADEAFKILSQAWSILSDTDKRTAYNLKLNIGTSNQTSVASPHCVPTQLRTQGTSTAKGASFPRNPAPPIVNQHIPSSTPGPIPIYQQTPARAPFHHNSYAPFVNHPIFSNPPSRPNTFWTTCTKCMRSYECEKIYLNRKFQCSQCQLPFLATEMPHALKTNNHSSSTWCFSHSQQHVFTGVTPGAQIPEGIKVATASNADGSLNKEKPVRRRRTKDETSGGRTGFKRAKKSVKELSQADIRVMLVRKAKTMILTMLREHEAEDLRRSSHMKRLEKAINHVKTEKSGHGLISEPNSTVQDKKSATMEGLDDIDVDADETISMMVPDANFHNFDDDRIESSFFENQIWAAYDDDDGMPRYYALVHNVLSRDPFKMKISWLNSKTSSEYGSLDWIGSGFTKTSGEYRVGKCEINRILNSFSHSVKWKKGPRGIIQLYPTKGDVWAVYRNWSHDWTESTPDEILHKYDVVVVLEDYNEDIGSVVAPLLKVAGFTSVFNLDLSGTRTIPREEMFRFSHQVPFYILNGKESVIAPQSCYELDPAALPLELLKVITDAEAAEERVSEHPVMSSGSDESVSDARVGSTSSGKSNGLQKKRGVEDEKNLLTYSRRKKGRKM